MDNSQPIKFTIPIKEIFIEVTRDFENGDEYATLCLIDDQGRKNYLEYEGSRPGWFKIAINTPSRQKKTKSVK